MLAGARMRAGKPQSAWRLLGETFRLYRRYPLLFLVLAAGVVVPYELVILLATGASATEPTSFAADSIITLANWVIVTPLVSALHVHAVADAREGRAPRLGPVARRGLAALPVVALAALISGLGIFVGFALLVVPGIYLMLRWFVVAQAAAIERNGAIGALESSHRLVQGNYWHVITLFVLIVAIETGPLLLITLPFGNETTVVSFLVLVAVQIALWSFVALATALLYFDLRTRRELTVAAGQGVGGGDAPTPVSPQPSDHDIDPRRYPDESRPPGWYVDPDEPQRMRYWTTGEEPGWAQRTTRTPGKVRRR